MYEDKLLETLKKSKSMSSVLRALMQLNPPFEYYVGAGSVTNTIWNEISGYPLEYGISDIDIIYYDKYNLDAHNETKLKKELERILGDFSFKLDVKNQARVHFWYESKFGFPIKPYISIETAIDSWPTTASAIGVRLEHNGLYTIYSPYGLNDLFSMVVRPNKLLVTQEIYESTKMEREVAITRNYTLVIQSLRSDYDELLYCFKLSECPTSKGASKITKTKRMEPYIRLD